MTDNGVLIIVIWLVKPQPQGSSAASAHNMIMLWSQFLYRKRGNGQYPISLAGTDSINGVLYELSTTSLLVV